MVGMALLADVFFGVVGVYESLVSNKQITSCECFGANVANERLLFGVRSNMALQMFLVQLCQWESSEIWVNWAGSTNLAKSLWQWGQGKVLFFEPELALRFVRPVAAVVSMVELFCQSAFLKSGGGSWREEELLGLRSRSDKTRTGMWRGTLPLRIHANPGGVTPKPPETASLGVGFSRMDSRIIVVLLREKLNSSREDVYQFQSPIPKQWELLWLEWLSQPPPLFTWRLVLSTLLHLFDHAARDLERVNTGWHATIDHGMSDCF